MMRPSLARIATQAPMIEQPTAPAISEVIGANSESTSPARTSAGSSASALPGLDQLFDQHGKTAAFDWPGG